MRGGLRLSEIINYIGHIYDIFLPIIFAAIANMIWCKLPICKFLKKPMDFGRTMKDGRRIFGDNKTWKGFFGMILLAAVFSLITGIYSFWAGAYLGLSYVIAELPNSFIKRRLGLEAGKNGSFVQTFFDQADSVIGFIIFLPLVYPETWSDALGLLIIGTATHYFFNILLYFVGLRNQKG
jgi:CDP-diglyceride synthetase